MNAPERKRGHHLTRKPALPGMRGGLFAAFGERAMARLFHHVLDRVDTGLEYGAIEVRLPGGTTRLLGGRGAGPIAKVHLHRWRALYRMVRRGSVGGYESWVAGDWSSPDTVSFFDVFIRNRVAFGRVGRASGVGKIIGRFAHRLHRNTQRRARTNIEAHYDLGNDFYGAWLDAGMTYSCAVFADDDDLEHAQARKIQLLLDRLNLKPGQDLLEIGCGWGSLAEAALLHGVDYQGITLSSQQKSYADARLAGKGNATVSLMDYRDVKGQFDAIASVEMVEAVGQEYWPAYLDCIAANLKPGGKAAVQFISIADDVFDQYARGVDFIQRYIFPGGMLLSESRFRALAQERGFVWQDQVDYGPHYADTLLVWRNRFDAAVDEGRLPAGFDAAFVRLWRYYLMYCEGGFRGGGINVSQVTLVKEKR